MILLKCNKQIMFVLLVIIFPFKLVAVSSASKLCNSEVKKEQINKKNIYEYCSQAAQSAIKKKQFANLSWFYLLIGNLDKNINEIQFKIEDGFLVNIGHSYLLKGDLNATRKMYKKFLKNSSIHWVNNTIQDDFEPLLKLYPQKSEDIRIGIKIWNELYRPLKPIRTIYRKYRKAKKEKKYREAIIYLIKVIQLEKEYHPNDKDIAANYNHIGEMYKALGEYSEALKFYKKDLNLSEKSWGKNDIATSLSYYSMGKIYYFLKDYANSLNFYQKALNINESIFGTEHEFTAIIHSNRAKVFQDMKEYTKALSVYQKVLNIRKKVLGNSHISTATTYNNIGLLYEYMGQYSKALEHVDIALNISTSILGEEHLFIAKVHNNNGLVYQSMGKYEKALEFYQKSLSLTKLNSRDSRTSFFTAYNNMGGIYEIMGEYPKALEHYKKALTNTENTVKQNATIYNNIAGVYKKIGEYSKSLAYYKKALKTSEKLVSSNYYTATVYNNIGLLHDIKGDYQDALNSYFNSLKVLDKNHPYRVTTYNNIALIYNYRGEYEKALEYFKKVLRVNEKILDEYHSSLATNYNNIGLVYQSLKKYNKALKFYKKALEIRKIALDSNHPSMMINYNSLGRIYYLKEKYSKAYDYSQKSFKNFIENRNKNFAILKSKTKENYVKENTYLIKLLFQSSINYLIQLNKKSNTTLIQNTKYEIFNHWLNYKGTIFEYENIINMVEEKTKDITIKKNIKELRKLTTDLANIEKKQLSSTNSNTYQKEINNIQEDIGNLEISLSKSNKVFKELVGLKDINLTQIVSKLDSRELYIDFAKVDEIYYILTVDNKSKTSFKQIDKNNTKLVEKNIKLLRDNNKEMINIIQKGVLNTKLKKKLKKESQIILARLYTTLIETHLSREIRSKNKLIISPAGLLNLLPFEALYNKGRYLIEDYQISYISSGREFIRQSKRDKVKNYKRKMISFGNPNFNLSLPIEKNLTRGKVKGFGGKNQGQVIETWEQVQNFLPIGNEELIDIRKLYPNALIYENENATVKNLMNVDSSQILHISTHGKFLSNNSTQNPMLNSGLAFAGANDTNDSLRGIATALKLSALDLKDTELVVLSACESGVGEVQEAEGVKGLPKAFLQAGARNVIMSLWSVSTQKTAMLMKKFYTNVHAKQDYATALQNAKLDMIKEHPYYWSAFIMHGI